MFIIHYFFSFSFTLSLHSCCEWTKASLVGSQCPSVVLSLCVGKFKALVKIINRVISSLLHFGLGDKEKDSFCNVFNFLSSLPFLQTSSLSYTSYVYKTKILKDLQSYPFPGK